MRPRKRRTPHRSREAAHGSSKPETSKPGSVDWKNWLEHWETWNALVADVRPPNCGLFGCDEKVKVGDKWKCVACGKITDS